MTFLAVAIGAASHTALDLFRYRSSSTYFDAGDILGTNYWKLSYQIGAYACLSIWIVLALSQLGSMFGYKVENNIKLWTSAAPMIGGLAKMVQGVIAAMAYDKAYQLLNDGDASNDSDAEEVQDSIWEDWVTQTLMDGSIGSALAMQAENWMYAQYSYIRMDRYEEMQGQGGQQRPQPPQDGQQRPTDGQQRPTDGQERPTGTGEVVAIADEAGALFSV